MSDKWDFYLQLVDDKPGSIFVDLGIRSGVPLPDLSHMAYVRLYMKNPRSDGLSSSEEFDALTTIEDALERGLCSSAVVYVGRNTSNGCRDFYFYVSQPETWGRSVKDALAAFSGYSYDIGTREDAEWSTYLNFLYPSDEDMQRIGNRSVCDSLDRNGDKLVAERPIDHWCYFSDEGSADAFVAEAGALGFQLQARQVRDFAQYAHEVRVSRDDVPSYELIDAITLPLFSAAKRNGGYYDGWECAAIVS